MYEGIDKDRIIASRSALDGIAGRIPSKKRGGHKKYIAAGGEGVSGGLGHAGGGARGPQEREGT